MLGSTELRQQNWELELSFKWRIELGQARSNHLPKVFMDLETSKLIKLVAAIDGNWFQRCTIKLSGSIWLSKVRRPIDRCLGHLLLAIRGPPMTRLGYKVTTRDNGMFYKDNIQPFKCKGSTDPISSTELKCCQHLKLECVDF